MPADFRRALSQSTPARATYQNMSPSQQREYLEWILDAKQPETRAKQIAQSVEWLAEGKPRNWKYMKR